MTLSPVRHASSAPVVAGVAKLLARLNNLTLDELLAERSRFCRSMTPRLSLGLMKRAIAYRIQEKAFGDLSAASKRKLTDWMEAPISAHDDAVSPYLLRPLRSYQEAMRDRAARISCRCSRHGAAGAELPGLARPETDDVEPPR